MELTRTRTNNENDKFQLRIRKKRKEGIVYVSDEVNFGFSNLEYSVYCIYLTDGLRGDRRRSKGFFDFLRSGLAFPAVTKTKQKKNKIQQRSLSYLKDSEKDRWREM